MKDKVEPSPNDSSGAKGVIVPISINGKNKLEWTGHALAQMKLRGITQAEVLKIIESPSETGLPTQIMRHRVRRYRSLKKAVDVVYEIWGDKIVVITAILLDRA